MKRSLALISSLVLTAAACGGDDETSDATAPDVTESATAATVTSDAAATSVVATTTPAAAATEGSTPPAEVGELIPGDPASLGAPPVPDATPASGPDATPIGPALAPYEQFGTDAAPGAFPRSVRHSMGETTIEARPQRVVVLDTGELDAIVELGITPVGAVDYGAVGLPAYLDGALDGVEIVGSVSEPNLEAIAALRPDLILSSTLRHEALYDELSQIAPTVFAERPGVAWKQNFRLYAQAVGGEAVAAETVARYEQRIRDLNAALPTPRPTISIVRVMEDGMRYYQRANFMGTLLTDLGVPRPESQNVDDFGVDLGQESIVDYADADLLVLALYGGQTNAFAADVLASDIWQAVPAVGEGRVLEVDDQTWIGGIGYRAAFSVLDQLAAHYSLGT
jgi:iron complex transport system substrate-binding protein